MFLPLLIALCLLVLPAVAGVALYRGWPAGGGAIAEQTQPAPVEVKAESAARCLHCGRILSKRRLDPATVGHFDPPYYEYTVSMADGSSRIFREQMPASWRVGERLYYIDGTRVD
ncbi:MAG TPA: hypothetical protein VFS80_03965 [Burkholderiales bacterium]|nr:hypothetical protein [Burkholderiales bacterium]